MSIFKIGLAKVFLGGSGRGLGGVEVGVYDKDGRPLEGAICRLSLGFLRDLRDTQVTGPSGIVFLDSHSIFCFGSDAFFVVDVTYATVRKESTVWSNPQCFAPVQNFQFDVVSTGCSPPCQIGFQCVNNQCVPIPPTGCKNNSVCPANMICQNGQCILPGGDGGGFNLVGLVIVGILVAGLYEALG